jgi:hypothetical protein
MKKILSIFILALCALSCSDETATQNSNLSAKSPNSISLGGDYNVEVTVSEGGSLWTYTVTKARTTAKNLSHFIINLNNCSDQSAIFADILWATTNGSQAVFVQTEGQGTTCFPQATTTNFVKFDALPAPFSVAGQPQKWVLVLKLQRGYSTVSNTAVWFKAGTSCHQGVLPGPGCPLTDYCSFSQGFFFANGATHNSASGFWSNGLTIGGVSYTQAQGNQFWNLDRGRGGNQTMNAFFQLGAVRLSGAESVALAADIAIIDTFFTGLNVVDTITTTTGTNPYTYFDLPASRNNITAIAVIAAAGRIGAYVDANHCQ